MRRRTEHGLPDRAKREWNMRFNSTFYSVGRGLGPDPQRWRALFDAYDPSAWQQDQSGALQFMTEDRTRYNLIL